MKKLGDQKEESWGMRNAQNDQLYVDSAPWQKRVCHRAQGLPMLTKNDEHHGIVRTSVQTIALLQ